MVAQLECHAPRIGQYWTSWGTGTAPSAESRRGRAQGAHAPGGRLSAAASPTRRGVDLSGRSEQAARSSGDASSTSAYSHVPAGRRAGGKADPGRRVPATPHWCNRLARPRIGRSWLTSRRSPWPISSRTRTLSGRRAARLRIRDRHGQEAWLSDRSIYTTNRLMQPRYLLPAGVNDRARARDHPLCAVERVARLQRGPTPHVLHVPEAWKDEAEHLYGGRRVGGHVRGDSTCSINFRVVGPLDARLVRRLDGHAQGVLRQPRARREVAVDAQRRVGPDEGVQVATEERPTSGRSHTSCRSKERCVRRLGLGHDVALAPIACLVHGRRD